MIRLDSPISVVPKIGPKFKSLLEKLEIYKVEDLLYHFPFRYEDYSVIKNITDLQENEVATVRATLQCVNNIFTHYRKRITKGKATDLTGEVVLIWFNQHYLKKTLEEGKVYNISGKVGRVDNKIAFLNPELEEISKTYTINTGRLVPVYPETSGLSSKWIRARINDVITNTNTKQEFLPTELLLNKNLDEFYYALKQFHFPDSLPQAQKAKERFSFEELFLELLNVEKRKHDWAQDLVGIKMKPFSEKMTKYIGSLPFKLTKDQSLAVEEILKDMQNTFPMNRLLEGDVGTGKTAVAATAIYSAYLNGYKSLFMAPTEILANQHYKTLQKLLPEMKVALNTSASSKDFPADWQIMVGTHALLFTTEKYKKVGLVIIDEQHRFGVEQRGKIMDLGSESGIPHLLSLTATPIPRTLALTLYGDLSISILREHPNKLRKISTKIIPANARDKAYEWVKNKNEPTFIVCPLIDESENQGLENIKAAQFEFNNLKEGIFKGIPMGLLHGKMKSTEKQNVIDEFRNGKIKILVSTPVIEVGMDIPDATIMMIESAERYGLASLHQLRGRVGRGEKEGFCFALMSTNSSGALSRLKNLERFNTGIELAEIDMKIRGQGDIFGTMQHGFKRLKLADLNDLEKLEDTKHLAQEYYAKLEEYPMLKQKLTERMGQYIPNN